MCTAKSNKRDTKTPGSLPGVFVCVATLVLACWLSGCAGSMTGKRGKVSSRPISSTSSLALRDPSMAFRAPVQTDKVVVEKSRRKMTVWRQGQVVATFPVALGRAPVGAKTCEGDMRTPEGKYRVTEHKPDSAFYRALRLSYPEEPDIARAREQGCSPGGNILIHGLENGFGYVGDAHRSVDWTRGCIAITNQEMDRLWTLVPDGTEVEIVP